MKLKIDEQLRDVLIPLTPEKKADLEASILQYGCVEPIITWNGVIVDGHNRYEICMKHGIPFETKEHPFADMLEARLWIFTSDSNQREATPYETCEMVMQFKEDVQKEAFKRMYAGVKNDPRLPGAEGEDNRTHAILGRMAHVGAETMRRAMKLHDEADDNLLATFLCSVQHDASADMKKVRSKVEQLMKEVAAEYALNTDFEMLVNPTGKFEIGGPFADSGVTGRKLACDTYGGVGHIGGGAMSGKDPTKVDRSGAYAARKIARDIIRAGFADKCEVQIAYAIGVAQPVSIHVECFGTEHQELGFIEDYILNNYDLTPKGIIDSLKLLTVDYNDVSSLGHFGKGWMPWEV